MNNDPLEVVNLSALLDADWLHINRLRRVYAADGKDALLEALRELAKDPNSYVRIVRAIFPNIIHRAIQDEMVGGGIGDDDLPELIKTLDDLPPS